MDSRLRDLLVEGLSVMDKVMGLEPFLLDTADGDAAYAWVKSARALLQEDTDAQG